MTTNIKKKINGLNAKLKKKSDYNLFYEFQTSFSNAILKWKFFFYCRHSLVLEEILSILWDLHCINGYLKYNIGTSSFLKVFLKKNLNGHCVVNQLACYSKADFISWVELKKIIAQENSVVYILSTSSGIFDGLSALRQGLGGCVLYKFFL